MKRSLLVITVILLSSSLNTAQTNPVTHEVRFDYYIPTFEHWYNLTMNDNSYSISSDDPQYDGWTSDVNFFNWYALEKDASDGGFFQLNVTDANPNYLLSYTRLEQSNTISLQQIPTTFDVSTGWIKMIYDVWGFHERILSIDYNEYVWPVASQIAVAESYPEQYSISVLYQRGNDATKCCFSGNISLFAGVDFDMNPKIEWIKNSTYSTSMFLEDFGTGMTTVAAFPTFSLRTGNNAEIMAYPLDRVTIMIIQENGMALLTSLRNGFQDFVFQTDITDATQYLHDYIQYNSIDDTDSIVYDDTLPDGGLELPLPILPVIFAMVSIKLVDRNIRKN